MATATLPYETALASVVRNCGIVNSQYNPKTGIHSGFGRGIFEFRIGDEIEIQNGGRHTVTGIIATTRHRGGKEIVDYLLQTGRGRHCSILVARPTNPERMTFGFVVRTCCEVNGMTTGGASRFITHDEADAEVERLLAVNYPGAIQILDSE